MSGLEARVLVCDPQRDVLGPLGTILHQRFGQSNHSPSPQNMMIVSNDGPFECDGVEYNVVDDLDDVVRAVRGHPAPYHSLVVYTDAMVQIHGSAGKIAKVAKQDPLLPQLVYGSRLSVPLVGQCARAGATYFADTETTLRDLVGKLFYRPEPIEGLTVVKVGGSAFDFDRDIPNTNLDRVAKILSNIHQDGYSGEHRSNQNRMIVMVGAGQYGLVPKDWLAKYGSNPKVQRRYPQAIVEALEANLENLEAHFADADIHDLGKPRLLPRGAYYHIENRSANHRVLLIATAPHSLLVREGIPLQDSDTHAIAVAEAHHAKRLVLIKRTDGIYKLDPYRGFCLDKQNSDSNYCADRLAWIRTQRRLGNLRSGVVRASEMLDDSFSREGTDNLGRADGTQQHIIEDSALRYFSTCQYVEEILVVHLAPEELHYRHGKSGHVYKHVVTGDKVHLPHGWDDYLERSIRDAFHGVAKSKIIRG